MNTYSYLVDTMPDKCVSEQLLQEQIQGCSGISVALDGISTRDGYVDVSMRAPLNGAERECLAEIITSHHGIVETSPAPIVSVIENPNRGSVALNFKLRPLLFNIPAGPAEGIPGAPYQFGYVSPYPIMLLGAVLDVHQAMVGDSFELKLLDDTVIGMCVRSAPIGQSFIELNPEAVQYVYPGFRMMLFDGQSQLDIGEVVKVVGNNVFLATPLAVEAVPGTYVMVEYSVVNKMKILCNTSIWTTRDTTRGANIPTGQPMQLLYWNTTGTAKEIQLNLSFYL